eukprot:1392863-Pyramimonas_sp.AAC.1
MLFVALPPCLFFIIFAIPCVFPHPPQLFFAEAPPWRASGGLTKVISSFLKAFWRPPGCILGASGGFLGPPCLQPRSP